MIPTAKKVSREVIREEPVETKHLREKTGGCWKPRATLAYIPFLIEKLNPADAHL
jgi:hypothetical protein